MEVNYLKIIQCDFLDFLDSAEYRIEYLFAPLYMIGLCPYTET